MEATMLDEAKVKKAEYSKKWREENPEKLKKYRVKYKDYNKEYDKKYRENIKENITYVIRIGSEYYFGHTSQGLSKRKTQHFADIKRGQANKRMMELFHNLGEEAFKNLFDMTIIGKYKNKAEAEAQEAYLLSIYVGKPGCINIRK